MARVKTYNCQSCSKEFPEGIKIDYVGSIICPFCLLKIYRQANGQDYKFEDQDLIIRLRLAHKWLEEQAKFRKVQNRVVNNLEKLREISSKKP